MLAALLLLACGSPAEAPKAPPAAPIDATDEAAGPMADSVDVIGPYARAMPPGSPNSAAFMTLRNRATRDARLVSAAASIAASVELHTHTEVDGVMQMRQVPEIVVPAGGDATLQPGGHHVMFIGLTGELTDGQSVAVTLSFADGSTRVVDVPVKAIVARP